MGNIYNTSVMVHFTYHLDWPGGVPTTSTWVQEGVDG